MRDRERDSVVRRFESGVSYRKLMRNYSDTDILESIRAALREQTSQIDRLRAALRERDEEIAFLRNYIEVERKTNPDRASARAEFAREALEKWDSGTMDALAMRDWLRAQAEGGGGE